MLTQRLDLQDSPGMFSLLLIEASVKQGLIMS